MELENICYCTNLPKSWLEPTVRIGPDTRDKVRKSPEIPASEHQPVLGDSEVGGGEDETPDGVEHGDGLGVDIKHAGLVILYQ